ncbi:signal peptidase I [Pancytospora philotis]|nr:signal peptidase I [Pancytospora philotis]
MFLFSKHEVDALRRLGIRQLIQQGVAACYSVMHTYMIWKAICLFLGNDSPIVVVLSESMEPGFQRGDILFLKPQVYKTGDIVVYQVYENAIPIVHRAIKITGEKMLTKGDNNARDDIGLYKRNRKFLLPEETRAGVFGFIPYFGLPTIYISSVPGLKPALLCCIGLSVFFTRE